MQRLTNTEYCDKCGLEKKNCNMLYNAGVNHHQFIKEGDALVKQV
jgi:hypothetical protein